MLKNKIKYHHNNCSVAHHINPLTPRSDKYVKSPYNFNTLSIRQVMRIKKIINLVILFGLVNKEMHGHQLGELAFRSWE